MEKTWNWNIKLESFKLVYVCFTAWMQVSRCVLFLSTDWIVVTWELLEVFQSSMELKRKWDILIESDSTKNSFQKKMFYFNGSYGPLIF